MPRYLPAAIPEDATSLDLLDWLLGRGKLSAGQVPLLYVLQQLVPLVGDAETLGELEQCRTGIAAFYGVTASLANAVPAPGRTENAAALMLEIWPTAPPGQRCHVRGQLFYAADRIVNVYVREHQDALHVEDRADQVRLVEDVRGLLTQHGVKTQHVVLEFILPLPLLSLEVDQWPNAVNDPLGIWAPVVVRPRERLRQRQFQVDWSAHWETVMTGQPPTLLHRLWEYTLERERQVPGQLQAGTCIVCRFVPDLQAAGAENPVYRLLHRGAAVALWPRQPHGLEALRTHLRRFMTRKAVTELPTVIQQMRATLWEQDQQQSPCYHLTLLWDDPNRRLPDVREHDEDFYVAPM